jgi:hypothetical protein
MDMYLQAGLTRALDNVRPEIGEQCSEFPFPPVVRRSNVAANQVSTRRRLRDLT